MTHDDDDYTEQEMEVCDQFEMLSLEENTRFPGYANESIDNAQELGWRVYENCLSERTTRLRLIYPNGTIITNSTEGFFCFQIFSRVSALTFVDSLRHSLPVDRTRIFYAPQKEMVISDGKILRGASYQHKDDERDDAFNARCVTTWLTEGHAGTTSETVPGATALDLSTRILATMSDFESCRVFIEFTPQMMMSEFCFNVLFEQARLAFGGGPFPSLQSAVEIRRETARLALERQREIAQ